MKFSNYLNAFFEFKVYDTNFIQMFLNSLIFTICGTIMSVGSSTLTAYIISKYKFRGRDFLFGLSVFILIVPIVGSIPATYKLVSDLGIKDNVFLISLLYGSGFGMNFLILHGFFGSISWSYAESGEVDGASDWQIFTRIMLPQARPAITAVSVITFINLWNDYLTPFLYLENKPTLAYGLYYFEKEIQFTYNFPVLFAGIIMAALPALIIFISFQKLIMENTVAGGLKG
jgi:ABC-type glycerol-3-phosphate transport system permease component